ncbi:MAG: 3-hydroxyacyl-ACP dehydratase FabZ [Dokdonella sp.]|uniref:3-hydroxyacyl-ACP dehydratase FabZ n=1 Tax=Dokdonella sp. TaxID=2291710 RepID=UPI002CB0B877|nr:3-hydroxyacyl-ACP dehydratase FabZ [Xanthomonadales bacterium]HQV72705.1 3-hydroxyacyl-ACP dehydratase FabZ [Dokdonella sp.]MBK7209491.1 3-hydroxyacyl-ACP dehydratase FabZ [Xanthomonadales bacterium]MBL0223300.1 3-hydroxyacyl-ACP dehydratase FabZ [Xanthomonadales bacterium]HQW76536.1 3-hydroxyacyl-ACP dehydratase FabZ [Dokdonella sp.]
MNDPKPSPEQAPIDVRRIAQLLPHRFPFLLIDRVTAWEPGKRLTAIKNVTYNEPFFQGHFPGNPVMPGVLVIEALAQASGTLVQLSATKDPSQAALFYLVKIDKARFSRVVVPGDQLVLEVEQKRMLRRMGLFWGQAKVDGEVVAEAELLCAERRE